jgi:hypothetical protein
VAIHTHPYQPITRPDHALILVELQAGRVKAEERHETTQSWMKKQLEEKAKSSS